MHAMGVRQLQKTGKQDRRKLADELVNISIVLSHLNSVQEVESQRFIASVVERLQPFL